MCVLAYNTTLGHIAARARIPLVCIVKVLRNIFSLRQNLSLQTCMKILDAYTGIVEALCQSSPCVVANDSTPGL